MATSPPMPARAGHDGQGARGEHGGRRRLWVVCAWLLAGNALLWLVLGNAWVWGPLWWHWRVVPETVADAAIEVHRRLPDDTRLATVAEMSMTTDHPLRGADAHAAAKELLRGRFLWPHMPVLPIGPEFSSRDLSQGVPVQQIFTSSLIVPDLMLRAHEHAPDPAWVAAAWRYTRGFIEHEDSLLLPRNYERNSHAVANRASVLARLWRHLRQSPQYRSEDGRLLHLHAQRVGALLAKPSNFIAATNHGVMQNIGLLQLAVAFPELPRAQEWKQLAAHRLALQLPGWIDADGAVLEHSSGYHFHGVVLSGYVARLLEMAGVADERWAQAHARTRAFMQTLQRPDRSLPAYGNTFRYAWKLPAVLGVDEAAWESELRARAGFERYVPVAGHAVWWSGESAAGVPTHTHVPWGYFPGHGHRRAQELSLLVWAGGTDWSTNTGYWPSQDLSGIGITDGWEGSNAPHALGEAAQVERRSRLVGHASGRELRFLDLERSAAATLPGSGAAAPQARLVVRRQVLQWRGSTWIVIDSHADPLRRPLRVLWTAAPELEQQGLAARSFRFTRPGSPVAMTLTIDGGTGVAATALRGSMNPFGGWVAFDRRAAPAPAVDARLAASETVPWMLATLSLHQAGATAPGAGVSAQPEPKVVMNHFRGPEDWALQLQDGASQAGRPLRVTRKGGELWVGPPEPSTGSAGGQRLALVAAEPADAAFRQIADARAQLLAAYPRHRTREWERRRQSNALLVAWALASVASVAAAAWWHRRRRALSRKAPAGEAT